MYTTAILALANGTIFKGKAIGSAGESVGEVVFNTSMTGYQEILTDPSYAQQIVTLTYPHIGNTGTTIRDQESSSVHAAGLVIRDLPLVASNWRSEQSLDAYLKSNNVVAIADIDTRKLTRILRTEGAQAGCLTTVTQSEELDAIGAQAVQKAKSYPGMAGQDLARQVTCSSPYEWTRGTWSLENGDPAEIPADDLPLHVVAYDFGVKRNILRMLVDRSCRVTVVPAQTPAEEVLAYEPDGIFLSNGPGDPEPCTYAIDSIQQLMETGIPMFGICLGHQLLGLASGAKTLKMKFGHHGANHPVKDLRTSRVMISSQNHGFAVDADTLDSHTEITHLSLFDGSLQGIRRTDAPAFGFQGHPEASPGPHDVAELFDEFVGMIKTRQARSSRAPSTQVSSTQVSSTKAQST